MDQRRELRAIVRALNDAGYTITAFAFLQHANSTSPNLPLAPALDEAETIANQLLSVPVLEKLGMLEH